MDPIAVSTFPTVRCKEGPPQPVVILVGLSAGWPTLWVCPAAVYAPWLGLPRGWGYCPWLIFVPCWPWLGCVVFYTNQSCINQTMRMNMLRQRETNMYNTWWWSAIEPRVTRTWKGKLLPLRRIRSKFPIVVGTVSRLSCASVQSRWLKFAINLEWLQLEK